MQRTRLRDLISISADARVPPKITSFTIHDSLSLSREKPRFAPRVKPRARARTRPHDRLCRSNRRRWRSRFAKEAERSRERKSNKILKNPRLPAIVGLLPRPPRDDSIQCGDRSATHNPSSSRFTSTINATRLRFYDFQDSIAFDSARYIRLRGTARSRARQSDFIFRRSEMSEAHIPEDALPAALFSYRDAERRL